ncbi:methionine synthase [Aeromicrobium sp.]|uniref:methionine synthase n=1 Tax=Aeromicrobium sp. TaxID=1871063 RepID=UPI0030C49C1E
MAFATGIGSMPGTDFAESLRIVMGEVGDLVHVPELPDRGVHAGMIGRTLAVLDGLGADLQPDGWRIGVGEGADLRRARSLLAQDLDVAEEIAGMHDGLLKLQVTGPLTLAASVERPRGDKMLADHGARREIAESLAEGLRAHIAVARRRFPHAQVLVQVDEPSIVPVLTGGIATASGFSRHRSVHPPEADALLRAVVEAITEAGARPAVHSCAPDVPVELLVGAGFTAITFDLSLARPDDVWAESFEQGTDLWFGVVPSTDTSGVSDKVLADRIEAFFGHFGFGEETYAERLVVTPTCGLAGASPTWAQKALSTAQSVAARR